MDAQLGSSSIRHHTLPLAPAQVIALGLVAASIGWAVWLLRDRPASEEVELLAGMVLPSSEMAIMEAAFDRAQLGDHRTEGGRVWVPRSRQSAYMRALVDAEALPREFGGSLRRALEKNSPWQSRAVQDELLRVATQEELSLVICSMPGIERAAVLYDTESRGGFDGTSHGQPAKTASVNVRTQPDTELDPSRVQAIRVLVSSSIAGLTPERVAVTDLRSGRVHAGPLDTDADRESAAAAADPALARRIAHERHLAAKVRQALSFIKGAAVDVTVEFAGPESDAAPVPPAPAVVDARGAVPLQRAADANAPAEIQPAAPVAAVPPPAAAPRATPEPPDAAPNAIFVSIAVPESYFQAACRAAAERAGQPLLQPLAIETQETERIRQHVLALLPATRDPARRRVVVTGFPIGGPLAGRRDQPSRAASSAVDGGGGRGKASSASLEEVVALVAAGRFDEVPRQIWLATMSVSVGLLAALLWMLGGRADSSGDSGMHARRAPPRIDWSSAGDPHEDGHAAQDRPGIARAATLLLCLTLSAGTVRATGADPVPPSPESVLPEPDAAPQSEPPARGSASATPRSVAHRHAGQAPQVLPALPLDGSRGSAGGDPVATSPRIGDWKLLAVIVAAFAAVGVASRLSRRKTATLPPDVFEVLGTAPLAGQHAVRIVRFGPKTLLIGVSTGGCQTLAEITDPQATACIAAACRGSHPPLRPAVRSDPRPAPPAATPRTGREAA
jgi:type III secretory pathway lipoprotein EscJ